MLLRYSAGRNKEVIKMSEKTGERIAKFMAAAGLCSRREAERWIEQGFVQVNGITIKSPALNITSEDEVRVKGSVISKKKDKPRIFRMHKPRGYLCTTKDPEGRKIIYDLLPKIGLPRLVYVGRLDLNSEGLLLLTDSPSLAEKLTNPKNGVERTYRVRIDGYLGDDQIKLLQKGIIIDKIRYKPIKVEREEKKQARNSWVTMTLTEGKNREIRRVMEHLGLKVSRLMRLSHGPFELSNLPKGAVDEIPGNIIDRLLEKMDTEI